MHLSLNGYKTIEDEVLRVAGGPHLGLKVLYFTDNELKSWTDFLKLAQLFPRLKYLYIASNNLPRIDISLEGVLPQLESLHLAGNNLDCWECLDRLNDLQSLKSLRMINIPFFESDVKDATVRRNLCIARCHFQLKRK